MMISLWICIILSLTEADRRPPNIDLPVEELPVEWPVKGAFCCGKTTNLIINGHFEYGNTNFWSSYSHDSDTLPGQYVVTDDPSDFQVSVTDHSHCESTVQYPMNDMFLLANGRTSQPPGSKATIWHQKNVNLNKGKWYRFCANFKNLQQCTFDVLPVVTIKLSNGVSKTATIDTDQTDSCDWQRVSFCFYATGKMSVQIMLKEDSFGDGNDLAVDDISIQEMDDPMLTITIQHQSNTDDVYASINKISTNDDTLPCDGTYYWFVLTLESFIGGMFHINWSAPHGWGNSAGSTRVNPYAVGPPWHLTTSFPGFNFVSNRLYLIGMQTPQCCEACLTHGFTYHVVYPVFFKTENNGIAPGQRPGEGTYTSNYGLTKEDRLAVEQWVGTSEPYSLKEGVSDSRDQPAEPLRGNKP